MQLRYLIIFVFQICFTTLIAQIKIEKEIKLFTENGRNELIEIIPHQDSTVLFLNISGINYENAQLIKLDSSLNKVWKQSFQAKKGLVFEKKYINENSIYLLFRKPDKLDLQIVKFSLANGHFEEFEIKMLHNFPIDFFLVLNQQVVLAGSYKSKPVIEYFRIFDNQVKALGNLFDKKAELVDVAIHNNQLFVLINSKIKCQSTLSKYDTMAKLISSEKLDDSLHILIDSRFIEQHKQLKIVGMYGKNCTNFIAGYFLKAADEKVKFYSFNDFTNFHAYLKPKSLEKFKQKQQLRDAKGKKREVVLKLNLSDPILCTNELILLAYDFFNEGGTYIKAVQQGTANQVKNMLNNAYLAVLDTNSIKTFDYAYKFDRLETTLNANKLHAFKVVNILTLFYLDGDKLTSKSVNTQNLKSIEDSMLINANAFESNVINWYDNCILYFGEEYDSSNIKNQNSFFIKKIKILAGL